MLLTSFSENLIAIPFLVAEKISSSPLPLVSPTNITSSSSFNLIARFPAFIMLLNNVNSDFLTTPFRVTKNKFLSFSNSRTFIIVLTFSSLSRFIIFPISFPRACFPVSGISYTFILNTFPFVVKIRNVSRFLAIYISFITSSSTVFVALTPTPPLFCERYVSIAILFT